MGELVYELDWAGSWLEMQTPLKLRGMEMRIDD